MAVKFRIKEKNDGRFYVEARRWWCPFWERALTYDWDGRMRSIIGLDIVNEFRTYDSADEAAREIKRFLDYCESKKDSGRVIHVDIKYE